MIVVKGSGAEEVKAPHTCPLCNSPLSAETALLFEPMSEAADQEKNECLLTGDIEI